MHRQHVTDLEHILVLKTIQIINHKWFISIYSRKSNKQTL